MWHLAELHQQGGNWSDYYGTQSYSVSAKPDYLHPTSPGHKAIADMAVWLVQRTLLGLQLEPLQAWERQQSARALPPPMFPGNAHMQGETDCMMYVRQAFHHG